MATLLSTGGNTTGIEVPKELVEELGEGKKPPVVVTFKEFTYRSTLALMGGAFMIPVSAAIRSKTAIKAGEKFQVQLEHDTEPRVVEVPPALQEALDQHPGAREFFSSLSNSSKKRYVLPIEEAKTEETRLKRILKTIADLEAGKK